jgi:putative copper resistance protein D
VGDDFLHAIPTAFDLLALAACLGALGCRLWVLPTVEGVPGAIGVEAVRLSLWRLLVSGMAALTVSSLAEFVGRAAEMSGQPLSVILPVLPTVLFHTHYGWVWLMRPIALSALWLGWWMDKQRPGSQRIPAVMLGAGALIAMTRSAAGHAADWGDLTVPEISDWVHLMASSLWGGGLLALSVAVLPAAFKLPARRRQCIAAVAQRFSMLAGITLAGVLLTGIYNAWLQVGTIRALWGVPYGRTLLVKLLLVIPLVALGASNHYTSVPLLQRRLGPPGSRRPLPRILAGSQRRTPGQGRRRAVRLVHRLAQKVWAEVMFVMGILICTALLLHGTPARHTMHLDHSLIHPEVPARAVGKPTRPASFPWAVPPKAPHADVQAIVEEGVFQDDGVESHRNARHDRLCWLIGLIAANARKFTVTILAENESF